MEWKIGEIRKVNEEWYQCVEFPFSESEYYCDGCSISAAECVDFICDPGAREDNKRVIFKKLKKVGEPYKFGRKLMQKYNIYAKPYLSDDYGYIYIPGRYNEVISIELKQTKEDMEEKKQKLDKLVKDYSYNRIPYEVFDNCLKQLYVDKQIGENNPSLKEFDLEAAKAGKPVCIRDGRQARIICFDAKGDKPIIALIEMGVAETPNNYPIDGKAISTKETPCDLMMLPEKKEGWVNVDKRSNGDVIISKPYLIRDEAIHNSTELTIDTVKINWEE